MPAAAVCRYEVIDFVAVRLRYAISGERTLEAFYDRLLPFATPFMALFERERLPHRSTLSRFLASLDQTGVEALRTLFLEDLLARPLTAEQPGGLWDRQQARWVVFDVDGTGASGSPTGLTQDLRSPSDASPVARGLRSWLSRTQTR